MFSTMLVEAQTKQPQFANQGEQEDYWSVMFFKEKYVKENFERFKGKITIINRDSILFDDKLLRVDIPDNDLHAIFTMGLIYPDVISGLTGNPVYPEIGKKVRLPKQKKSLKDTIKSLDMKKFLSYRITNVEEVKFLNISPHIKRFRFWLFNKLMLNPTVCFAELTNETATTNTSLSDFINGSELTFFMQGWVVI